MLEWIHVLDVGLPTSCKPAVHAQADKDGRSGGDGGSSTGHAKDGPALANDCFLCSELRVARHVGESAEAHKGCAA